MRTIYFLRHGLPELPGGKKTCLGRTDLRLSRTGAAQAALAAAWLADKGISAAFTSPLLRARETAALLDVEATPVEGLEELYAGDWDGLTFDEIKEKWPELFAGRGKDPSLQPPGAEDRRRGLRRFRRAVDTALAMSTGNIVIVAHSAVTQLLLADIRGVSLERARETNLPYGSLSAVQCDGDELRAERIGSVPRPTLDETVCLRLLRACDAPMDVIGHSGAVAREAMRIVCALAAAGRWPDEKRIFSAAWLHDMLRREPEHPQKAAELMRGLGYGDVAELIRQHHELDDPEQVSEAAVVYIADKLVRGTDRVTLAERFDGSLAKCGTQQAIDANRRRYGQALETASRINEICGKEVIK